MDIHALMIDKGSDVYYSKNYMDMMVGQRQSLCLQRRLLWVHELQRCSTQVPLDLYES